VADILHLTDSNRKSHILTIPALILVLVAATPLAHSQTPDPAATPPIVAQPQPSPAQTEAMQGMEKMSQSVTKMSEMCQMMMQREMAGMPYKMAAGITFGVLLVIALVLFVILEVQWIIYWARLLKQQRGGGR
jgi:hypothetical protein